MTYRGPINDITFALGLAGFDALAPHFPECDSETLGQVLAAASDYASEVLAPLNRVGDSEGARFENGRVFSPTGFSDAYRRFVEGGWGALSAESQFGGQALPKAVELAVFEMIHAANMAFGLCPMLTRSAIEALTTHGTQEQKARYLPKLVSGEWTGTMNLTEAQAGSDLGALRTRAEPDGERYRLFGSKIFITWGDHDMAENIVHLVLARLPDAPEGSRGISLFLAPKRLVADNGVLGPANRLAPTGIEKKLGIHGSPTCSMSYDGAAAELIGAPHQGLAQMFTMMNAARLQVGVEGLAIGEHAFQLAFAYALERRQGKSALTGDTPAPIFDHPDVRRTLMLMKAKVEAARAICFATAVAADLARCGDTETTREAARLREELLTPIAKAWSTEVGVEVASMGIQVHGGAGYIEEAGAAQLYRDARIAPIYEGTNGIQAIDLMGRKLALAGGAAVAQMLDEIAPMAHTLRTHADEWLHVIGQRLEAALAAAREATAWMIERRGHAQPDALSGASAYLTLLGDLAGGYFLAKSATVASANVAWKKDGDLAWQTRIGLARLYADHVLARAPGLKAGITAGAIDLIRTSPAGLASR